MSVSGILLNPVIPRHHSCAAPAAGINNSGSSAASSASSSSDAFSNQGDLGRSLRAQSAGGGPKIRFAPLPDPRKLDGLDNDSVTSLSDNATPEASARNPAPASPLAAPLDISLVAKRDVSASSLQKKITSMWSTKRLLKPLLSRQSSTSPDDGSPYSSLFRVPSLESIRSTQSAMSAFSFRRRDKSPNPRSSTSSLMTFGSSDQRERERAASVTSSQSLPVSGSQGSTSRRPETSPASYSLPRSRRFPRPHTMLNGRVYGRHRGALTPDPFQNQRPAHEDEFVEWGFGGLGSVPHSRATGAAADWNRVRGGRGIASVADEDDDGSGMRWVKRRREQRAKEAAEKAAAEARASDDAEIGGQPRPNTEGGVDDHDERATLTGDTPSSALPHTPSRIEATSSPPAAPAHDAPPNNLRRSSAEHHDTAVAVLPPPHQHHAHHRPNPSRTASLDNSQASNLISHTSFIERASDTQSSTSEEPTDEGENTEDGDDEDDDDTDEEVRHLAFYIPKNYGSILLFYPQTERDRKTAESAGVEKISRHRDIDAE